MKTTLANLGIKLALVGVSLVVALFLGEGLVRLVEPQDLEANLSWYEAHPVYRFRHRPNLDRQARWSTPYHLQTNSRGLRGAREVAYAPGDHWRVLVHGDSFTFGNGLDEQHLFVTLAEMQLHQRGIEDAQVVNMGVSAFGSSLAYLYFLEEGRRYQPDVVVIAVFLGNDFIDDYRDGAFTLDGGQLVYHPFEVPWLKRMTNTALYQFLAARSHLLVFLRTRLFDLPGQQRQVEAYTDYERFDELYALNEAVLLAFREEVDAARARPVFLLLPSPWQLLAEQDKPVGEGDYFPQAGSYRDALMQTCREQHLHCLDLVPVLAHAADDPWTLFLKDAQGRYDYHYNQAGSALVAGVLADELERLYHRTRP